MNHCGDQSSSQCALPLETCGIRSNTGDQRDPDAYPLSVGQQGLWFHYCQYPDDCTYNVLSAQRIDKAIESELVVESFQSVLDTHPILRATFNDLDGIPFYRQSPLRADLEILNCSFGESDGIDSLLDTIGKTRIDLRAGPACRLFIIAGGEFSVLVMLCHHIVIDAWSLPLIWSELFATYEALLVGLPPRLSPSRATFQDFVSREASLLLSAEGDALKHYWLNQFHDGAAMLNLPFDYARKHLPRRGSSCPFSLTTELSDGVHELARSLAVTPFAVLFTAYSILLSRYSGQKKFSVGCPIALRKDPNFSTLVGYLVNILPFSIDLSGSPNFINAIRRVAATVTVGIAKSEYPFLRIVEDVGVSGDSLASAVFNLLKQPANCNWNMLGGDGPAVSVYEVTQPSGQFDLLLELVDHNEAFHGQLKYDSNLFRAETAYRFTANFESLLTCLVQQPRQVIGASSSMSRQEEELVNRDWCGMPYLLEEHGESLWDLIEAHCNLTPNGIALVEGDRSLSYRELRQNVELFAGRLRRRCIENELVGIYLMPSIEFIVSMLGVLRAGCAYLPLNPEDPKDRISTILRQAEPRLVVTSHTLGTDIQYAELIFVEQEDLSSALKDEDDPRADRFLSAGSLAYILFTSGTDGVPKGVMVEHRNIVNWLRGYQDFSGYAGPSRGMVCAPFTFDASVFEVFTQLCFGGTLFIPPENVRFLAGAFTEFVVSRKLTSAWIPPGQLADVIESFEFRDGGTFPLRRIFVGADSFSQHLLGRLLALSDEVKIINAYGPTEATIAATLFEFDEITDAERKVPIGRPMTGYSVHIVDDNMSPVPVGAIGEILIGGAGVARGYLNQGPGTTDRFIPHPFYPDQRCYRSGDLGRWLSDGCIEFMGRVDHQIKIRGIRIEPSEIESVLIRHSDVRAAHVVHVCNRERGDRIVAFVVPKEPCPNNITLTKALRESIAKTLPRSYVPDDILVISALPLTSSGKLDLRSLLALAETTQYNEATYIAARNETERRVLSIWESVLGRSGIGVGDDFFALGGNSLLALRILARLEEECSMRLPLNTLFASPTIESLAEIISSQTHVEPTPRAAINRTIRHLYQPQGIVPSRTTSER